MTKVSRIVWGLVILAGATLTFLSPLVFSAQQQVPDPEPNLDTPARQALAKERLDAWLHKRIPHSACPNCFTVEGEFGIHETVPGTDFVITRDLPDPAPLEPGKIREQVHPETGEPLWYKGNQAFVGPTDEENVSNSLPIPLIAVRRIRYRHNDELFNIEGVHSVGIGEKGLLVRIVKEKSANRRLIPAIIEGIPVIVEEGEPAVKESHGDLKYRPVPVGASIDSLVPTGLDGSVGALVVRDIPDIGACCQTYFFTAGHAIQSTSRAPSLAYGSGKLKQGGEFYGYVGWMFQEVPCSGGYFSCSTAPLNDTRQNPDVAAIGHNGGTQGFDPYPAYSPCMGAAKPVRRMVYGSGTNQWVNGPTGILRIPSFSSCPGNCLKNWGVSSHGTTGTLIAGDIIQYVSDAFYWYKEGPYDMANYSSAGGDSGALIAWDGSRDIVGLHIATSVDPPFRKVYIRLDFAKMAFARAGVSFDHFWGTSGGVSSSSVYPAYRPSYPPPSGSSLSTDPLNPSPCRN